MSPWTLAGIVVGGVLAMNVAVAVLLARKYRAEIRRADTAPVPWDLEETRGNNGGI